MVISKAPYKITSVYIALVLGVFPLWTGFGSYAAITGAKYRFFLLLTICYIALMAVCVIAKALTGRLKGDSRPGLECLFLILFLLSALVSCALSPYDAFWGEGRREGFFTLALYVIPFLFVAVYGKLQLWHLFILSAAALINALLSFSQLLGQNPFSLFPRGLDYYDAGVHYAGSFLGTMGNTNVLSAFACIALSLLTGGSAAFHNRKGAKLLLVPIFALSALMVWSKADSGAVAMVCCAVFVFPFVIASRERRRTWALPLFALLSGFAFGSFFPFTKPQFTFCPSFAGTVLALLAAIIPLVCCLMGRQWKITAKGLIIFYLTVLIIAFALLYFVPFSSGAMGEAHLLLHGRADPSFGSGRLRIWKRALQLIAEKPLFGGGPDTFVKRVSFEFSRFIEETGQLRQMRIDCAHNDYLNIAANCGLASLGFYLLALGTVLIKAIKNHRNAVVFALLAAIIAYMAQLMFTFSVCSVSPVFYTVLALAANTEPHPSRGGNTS